MWSVSTVKEEMSVEELHQPLQRDDAAAGSKETSGDPVPPGYHTLTTYLVARDADGLIDS